MLRPPRLRPCDSAPKVRTDGALSWILLLALCIGLGGCVAVGATLAGLGFNHQMSGIQYRTFTEPLSKVSYATLTAFKRMAFKLETVQQTKTGELIKGSAADRKFEVELESLTQSTTRMRAVAKNQMGVIVDASIAQEIIRQAEKALDSNPVKKRDAKPDAKAQHQANATQLSGKN